MYMWANRGVINGCAYWHGRRLGYILRLPLVFLVPKLEVDWPVPESDIYDPYEDARAVAPDLLLFWFRYG